MITIATYPLWVGFTAMMVVMLMIDFYLCQKQEVDFLKSVACSLVWVLVSLIFSCILWLYLSHEIGIEAANFHTISFLTGYILEKALAIDNIFIWIVIFSHFSINIALQRKILVYGIIGAIFLRTAIVLAGSWAMSHVTWVLYPFGILLLFTGIKIALSPIDSQENISGNFFLDFLDRVFKSKEKSQDNLNDFSFYKDGMISVSPPLIALIMIEVSDIIFAIDSIPAVLSVTSDPFIVLTSNILAVLGLRSMYIVLSNLVSKFYILKYSLSIILIFTSIKMLISQVYHISAGVSLSIIGIIICTSILAEIWLNKRRS
jgi:TerC family integral membrane protein